MKLLIYSILSLVPFIGLCVSAKSSVIIPTGTYNDTEIKALIGSSTSMYIADGETVTIDKTWDFTTGVDTYFYIEIDGSGTLAFIGAGGNRSEIFMLSTQGILINNINNKNALTSSSAGGNVRITIGGTEYQGNDFQTIIDAGGAGAPLPVGFGYFIGTTIDSDVKLEWTTLWEINASHFEIVITTDLETFEVLGEVEAIGNTNKESTYYFSFTHDRSETLYIKLIQYDMDGSLTESKIIIVNPQVNQLNQVFPNPCNNSLVIDTEFAEIKIINNDGVPQNVQFELPNVINTSNYIPGIYIIFIDNRPIQFIIKH